MGKIHLGQIGDMVQQGRKEWGTTLWPLSIRNKVEDYIDSSYKPEHRNQSKKQYSHPTAMNARIFLEWHNRQDCTLKFNPGELKEIQNMAGI